MSVLEDIEEINQLKAEYCCAMDESGLACGAVVT